MNITTLGIDLEKSVFHLHGVDELGQAHLKRKLTRTKLLPFVANMAPCLILMEACTGAHYWSRQFTSLGHQVKLIAPQFVKPFVKSNKNDYNDAEAIVEAGLRPSMRFVPSKSIEQQDIQSVHRVRTRLMKNRTALVNQMRGLLGEYGLVCTLQIATVRRFVPEVLEDGENELTAQTRLLLDELYQELVGMC